MKRDDEVCDTCGGVLSERSMHTGRYGGREKVLVCDACLKRSILETEPDLEEGDDSE